MWFVLKRLFQATCFTIWALTLINLIILSTVTFFCFNLALAIFLFWLFITSAGWLVAIVPILKFVFVPWYRRECRSWTRQQRKSRRSVAFFHPSSNDGGERERILWAAIDATIKKYQNDVQIIIFTGDSEGVLRSAKDRFNRNLDELQSSVTFLPLRTRFLLEAKYYRMFSVLGPSIGSMIVGFEALMRFIPDVYVDCEGYAFTYPCFYYLASVPIVSYVDHPTITTDQLEPLSEHSSRSIGDQWNADSSLINQLKFVYYHIFAYIYGWCGRCSQLVYCNSSWTKRQIELLWGSYRVHLLQPPYDLEQFLTMPLLDDEDQLVKTIVSVGPLRSGRHYELQIRAFHQLLQKKSDYPQTLRLLFMTKARSDECNGYVEQLQMLVDTLNLNDVVKFKFDATAAELKTELNQATIGLQALPSDGSDIDVVEMMAAGLIVLAHTSTGATESVILDGQTGFLASDLESCSTKMDEILDMKASERRHLRQRARDSVSGFSLSNFDKSFVEQFDPVLFHK